MRDDTPRGVASQSNSQVRADFRQPMPWLMEGVATFKAITLLVAPEKTGKTTFLSLLLDRRREGGRLLGKTVLPGTTVVCSEEDMSLWALRQPPLDFGPNVEFCRPIGPPTPRRWRRFLNHVWGLTMQGADLVVIDTIMSFLPAGSNNPQALRSALLELRNVADQSAVLLLHQMYTAKNPNRVRGPLTAFADIIIEMHTPSADRSSRRRTFTGVGRLPGTLDQVTAELNPQGTDYILLPDDPTPAPSPHASLRACGISTELAANLSMAPITDTLHQLIRESTEPITRLEILARWPAHQTAPNPDVLSRHLSQALEHGLITRTGTGSKSKPFRYNSAPSDAAA